MMQNSPEFLLSHSLIFQLQGRILFLQEKNEQKNPSKSIFPPLCNVNYFSEVLEINIQKGAILAAYMGYQEVSVVVNTSIPVSLCMLD